MMPNNTPLITVIVPVYNSPDLAMTLASVLEQDYPRIQLIVIDDGSCVFSQEFTEAYLADHKAGNLEECIVRRHSENFGTVRTLNEAISLSRGEYVFTLAGDDCFYDSRVLSDWVAEFQRTGANVLTAYRAVYDEAMACCSGTEPEAEHVRMIREKSPRELFEILAEANFIFGCCTARTAANIEKYGLFDERYRLIEDHSMYLKLLRMGEPIVFFDRIVVKYRGGGASSPGRFNSAYAKDVNNILQNEVLPYTLHPVRMRYRFARWKKRQNFYCRYNRLYERYSGNKAAKLLLHIWFYMYHPGDIAGRIINHLKKDQGGD